MNRIPDTENSPVLRTDFSDEAAWESLCTSIRKPAVIFRPNVEFVSDPQYNGISVEQALALLPVNFNHSFLFIVDQTALTHPEHPVLVVDLFEQRGRTFRVIPSEMWGVENNLSIANMDFADFADNVDADGIFRDFPRS